jgi:hypothetical protein
MRRRGVPAAGGGGEPVHHLLGAGGVLPVAGTAGEEALDRLGPVQPGAAQGDTAAIRRGRPASPPARSSGGRPGCPTPAAPAAAAAPRAPPPGSPGPSASSSSRRGWPAPPPRQPAARARWPGSRSTPAGATGAARRWAPRGPAGPGVRRWPAPPAPPATTPPPRHHCDWPLRPLPLRVLLRVPRLAARCAGRSDRPAAPASGGSAGPGC